MAWLVQLLDDVVVHKFELKGADIRIGRKPDNDIVIDDAAVSSQHARILVETNPDFADFREIFIEDLNSTNGTSLNGRVLVGRQRLHHKDTVQIAWNSFKFIDQDEAEMERTVHMLRTQGLQQ